MNHTPTPGPWLIERRKGRMVVTVQSEHMPVGHTVPVADCGPDTEENQATAELIAAAPELLEALRDLAMRTRIINARQHAGVRITDAQWSELFISTHTAEAAIDKAEGRA